MSRGPDEEEEQGPRAHRILAIGGGKGGVGKTLIAANLGIYLAQIGKRRRTGF